MKKSKHTYLLLPLASIIVVIAIVAVAIVPKIGEINDLNTNIQIENDRTTQLLAKRDQLLQIQESESDLLARYNLATIALPDQKYVANLIITFESLAERSGISIGSLQVNPGTLVLEKPGISQNAEQLEVVLTTQGTIDGVKAFLKGIYSGVRLINVNSINITTSQVETTTVQLSAIAYYKPRPELPQNAEESIPEVTEEDNILAASLEALTSFSPEGVLN